MCELGMALAQLVLLPHLTAVLRVSVFPYGRDPWRSREGSDRSHTSEALPEVPIARGPC